MLCTSGCGIQVNSQKLSILGVPNLVHHPVVICTTATATAIMSSSAANHTTGGAEQLVDSMR
jgi:hypothetical protein